MPNTIVLNTRNGAVTEYAGFGFQCITPTHLGSATGLFTLGGNADVAVPIVANVLTGKKEWGSSLKKMAQAMYFALKGSGTSAAIVAGESASYSYPIPVQAKGQSRAIPGKGIRENYLAFGYSNTDGADFQLDRIEVLIAESKTRKV